MMAYVTIKKINIFNTYNIKYLMKVKKMHT